MKKQLAILGVCLLFITLCFSGCELIETKPDYITVICQIQANVYLLDKDNNMLSERPIGLVVDVEVIKAGGENFNFERSVGAYGGLAPVSCSFELYREQDIEAVVTVQGGYEDYYPVLAVHSKVLTWAEVDAAADFGGTYSWLPMFQIGLKNDTSL